MNSYQLGTVNISDNYTSEIQKNDDIITLPNDNEHFKILNQNVACFTRNNHLEIIFNYKNYHELTLKYQSILKLINPQTTNIYFASGMNFDDACFSKFKTLLSHRKDFLTNKIDLIDVQIFTTRQTLDGYQSTLSKRNDRNLRQHFYQHEIPQETARLKYLEHLKTRTTSEIKKLEILHNNLIYLP